MAVKTTELEALILARTRRVHLLRGEPATSLGPELPAGLPAGSEVFTPDRPSFRGTNIFTRAYRTSPAGPYSWWVSGIRDRGGTGACVRFPFCYAQTSDLGRIACAESSYSAWPCSG